MSPTTSSENGLRVVHLLPSTDDAGTENQVLYLLRELRDRVPEIELELAYFRVGRAHARFRELELAMHEVVPRGKLSLDARRRARVLRTALGDRAPDMLHTWLYEANVVGARFTRRWSSTSLVMTQRSGDQLRDDPRRLRTMRSVYPTADHVLANSEEGLRLLLDVGCDSGKVSIVPNAIGPERVVLGASRQKLRADLGVPADAPLVCAVGRADEAKDLPTLLSALALVRASLPDVRLVLGGVNESDLARFGLKLPSYGLALGWLDHPADLMAASDVLAMASRTEGHSNVADEALVLATPIACTDTGAHVPLVRRAGGSVVPIGDPEALAEAIATLIRRPPNPEQMRGVADELRSCTALAETVTTYRRILARRGRDVQSRLLVTEDLR